MPCKNFLEAMHTAVPSSDRRMTFKHEIMLNPRYKIQDKLSKDGMDQKVVPPILLEGRAYVTAVRENLADTRANRLRMLIKIPHSRDQKMALCSFVIGFAVCFGMTHALCLTLCTLCTALLVYKELQSCSTMKIADRGRSLVVAFFLVGQKFKRPWKFLF